MNIRLWLAQKLLPKGYEIIDLNVGDVVGDAYTNTILTQATGPAQPAPKDS